MLRIDILTAPIHNFPGNVPVCDEVECFEIGVFVPDLSGADKFKEIGSIKHFPSDHSNSFTVLRDINPSAAVLTVVSRIKGRKDKIIVRSIPSHFGEEVHISADGCEITAILN